MTFPVLTRINAEQFIVGTSVLLNRTGDSVKWLLHFEEVSKRR